MTDTFVDEVAQRLRDLGISQATSENTGGWIFCVLVPDAKRGGVWYFGTANTTWDGNLMSDEGDAYFAHDIHTPVDSDCDDAGVVAAAIYVGLWVYNHKEV